MQDQCPYNDACSSDADCGNSLCDRLLVCNQAGPKNGGRCIAYDLGPYGDGKTLTNSEIEEEKGKQEEKEKEEEKEEEKEKEKEQEEEKEEEQEEEKEKEKEKEQEKEKEKEEEEEKEKEQEEEEEKEKEQEKEEEKEEEQAASFNMKKVKKFGPFQISVDVDIEPRSRSK